jgi:hypothetical protein
MKLSNLEQQIGLKDSNQLPPMEQWQPALSGDMDMVIRKDGSWWHEGVKIQRERLVRLFASILRKEGEDFFILTPVEKWRIQVEDHPFMITMIDPKPDHIDAITNTGDLLIISSQHPLKLSELDGELLPEIDVRNGLKARFSRNAFYDLAGLAEEKPSEGAASEFVIRSAGVEFKVG